MRVVLAAVAILSLTGWMQVTGTKDMMARDPMDCVNPVAVASPRQMFQTPVASHAIADIPGKTLTSMLLTAPPGSKSLAHRHAGVVFGYVIEGAVCSQITGDAGLKAYVAGDSFFEPAESQHLAFINPGMVTAKVLVTQVADTGAQLTSPVK